MKALLQRVTGASVTIDGHVEAAIDRGLVVLLGVHRDDSAAEADWLADKTLACRIFPDAAKPMNRSVRDIGGDVLVVSQFTLAADTRRGNRPSFIQAAPPAVAEVLYERYVARLRESGLSVQTGRFGADMGVQLFNDGPVTIMLER